MGVPDLVVVLLCVLGAGAVVVAGAAFGKQFISFPVKKKTSGGADGSGVGGGGSFTVNYGQPEEMMTERDWNQRLPAQDRYLRQVREHNLRSLYGNIKADRKLEKMERIQQEREMSTPGASRGFDGFSQHPGTASRSDIATTPGTPGYSGYAAYDDNYSGSRGGPSAYAQATQPHGGVVPGYGGHGDVRYQEDV